MPVEDSLKKIEERLTRLEAALTQQPGGAGGVAGPGGAVVDPPPWYRGGWGIPHRPIPSPVVDPAPWWYGGWPPGWPPRWPPSPVVDPAPWPTPVVDPAPWAGGQAAASTLLARIGHVGDPPPIDVGRLTASQLESALHTINAERSRLDATEQMIKQQIEKLKKG